MASVFIAITSLINLTEYQDHPFDQYTTIKHTGFLIFMKTLFNML